MPVPDEPFSAVSRLLESVSWEDAAYYRRGGRGRENVLTTEVFQALEFLPRDRFLGAVLRGAQGATEATRRLAGQSGDAEITILSGDHYLVPKGTPGRRALAVQPDVVVDAPGIFCMVEAKRIKAGSFQEQQLAREYLAVRREAKERGQLPLLLLVIPKEPPVRVAIKGSSSVTLGITEAISRG